MKKKNVTANEIVSLLKGQRDDNQRDLLMRFFKTGIGQYGEGDKFLGLKVPQTRAIVKEAKLSVSFDEIANLLNSEWHEVRLAGFLLIVEEMRANLPKKRDNEDTVKLKTSKRKELADFYLKYAKCANNWDLVDLSCVYILGPYLQLDCPDYMPILLELANSKNLWEQRIAIVTTLYFIRNDIFYPALTLVNLLYTHNHDLIHKAMGWVLREIGKKDKEVLTDYLDNNYLRLPRTSLRYAIEKFPEQERVFWLNRR